MIKTCWYYSGYQWLLVTRATLC